MTNNRNCVAAIALLSTILWGITEKEAVLIALEKNPDARIVSIEASMDSIAFDRAVTERKLSVTAGGNTALFYDTDSSQSSLKSDYSIAASKSYRSGGRIAASFTGGYSKDLSNNSTDSRTMNVSVMQPLLQGGWGRGESDVKIDIAVNNLSLSKINLKEGLSKAVAEVRIAYWNCVLAIAMVGITEAEIAYADSMRTAAVARYRVGTGTETDTLSAALEIARARGKNLAAILADRQSKENLAFLLGLNEGEIKLPEADSIIVSLPSIDEATDSMMQLSAPLAAMNTAIENLKRTMANTANKLLPVLNLEGGYKSHIADASTSSSIADNGGPYAGLSFSWDILAHNARTQKKENDKQLQLKSLQKEKTERELRFKLKQLYDLWKQDSLSLEIKRAQIVIAEKAYKQLSVSYRLGAASSLELERAKNDLVNARTEKLSSEISLKKAAIAVELSSGLILNRCGVNIK